jgi:hypothetical protein
MVIVESFSFHLILNNVNAGRCSLHLPETRNEQCFPWSHIKLVIETVPI